MFHNHYSLLQNVLSGGFTLGGSIPSITSLYGHMINAIQSRDSYECEVTNEGWSIGCVGMSSQASCLFQQPPLDELPGKPGKPIALDSLDWFLLELLLALKCESQTWRHSLLMISFVAQPIVATHTAHDLRSQEVKYFLQAWRFALLPPRNCWRQTFNQITELQSRDYSGDQSNGLKALLTKCNLIFRRTQADSPPQRSSGSYAPLYRPKVRQRTCSKHRICPSSCNKAKDTCVICQSEFDTANPH